MSRLSSLSSCHEVAAATTTTTTVSNVMMSLSKSKLARQTDESTTTACAHACGLIVWTQSGQEGQIIVGKEREREREREERRKSPLNNRTDDDARRDYCYKTNNLRSRSQLSTPVADRAACTSGMTSPKKMANIRVGRGLWRFSISWSKLTTPL